MEKANVKIPANARRGVFDVKTVKLPECNNQPSKNHHIPKKTQMVSGFDVVSDAVITII